MINIFIVILDNQRGNHIPILYERRGQEIKNLKEEIQITKTNYEQEIRSLRHELALLKGEKER